MGITFPNADQEIAHRDLPVPSPRMAHLFYEFLNRYSAWKAAKYQERVWLLFLFCLVICFFLSNYYLVERKLIIGLDLFLLAFFSFAAYRYIEFSKQTNHSWVNVNALYHHIVGKLEVGFCDHDGSCRCVEDFCSYVAKEYRIFFRDNYLK